MQYLSKTTQSGVWIAEHAACKINVPADVLPVMERRTLNNRYTAKLAAGEALHFEKYSVVHSSRDMAYEKTDADKIEEVLKADGRKVLQEAEKKGYEGLLKESTEEWKKYWEKERHYH